MKKLIIAITFILVGFGGATTASLVNAEKAPHCKISQSNADRKSVV